MNQDELNSILKNHKKWLDGNGGQKAVLQGADLREANLRWTDLRGANLRWTDLRGANLRWTDLRGASLRWTDLRRADLQGANLQGAYLQGANLQGVVLPPPTILLLCCWGNVSDKLCTALMRYDASNHPNPSKFDEWAKGGSCPYSKGFQRCANFQERRELWKPGKAKSARELVLMLFKEKDIKYDNTL